MAVECSRVVELSLLESLHYRSSGLVCLSRVIALQFLTYPLHFYFYYIGPLCSATLISLYVGSEVCLSGMTKKRTYTLCKRAWDNSQVGMIGRPRYLDSSMSVIFLMRFSPQELSQSPSVPSIVWTSKRKDTRTHACVRARAHTYTTLSPPPPTHTPTFLS